MAFNSLSYLIYLLVIVVGYYLIPRKSMMIKNIWLLVGSYFFYMQWNAKYALLILFVTLVTYLSALLSDKYPEHKKIPTTICIIVCLSLLGYFKYSGMFGSYLSGILSLTGCDGTALFENIILPVGISFYTLQSIGYLIDVYRGKIKSEKNIINYALFVSFFPQLVAGPIERSENLLHQFREEHTLKYDNFREGIMMIMYGLFLKMVIADGSAIIVNTIYDNYETYKGMYVFVGSMFFLFQVYGDFYGYSTIARGSALLLDIHLMDNFKAPLFSATIKEFWRRWHISLTGWFKEYLYFPLGGSRKGRLRSYINLMIVFLVSGLWHGASLSFVAWGGINGLYQVCSDIKKQIFKRDFICEEFVVNKVLKRVLCLFLIILTMIFFRAGQLKTALVMFRNMLLTFNPDILFNDSLFELGMTQNRFTLLFAAIIFMMIVDYFKYKEIYLIKLVMKQPYWFRLLSYTFLFLVIILVGFYGEGVTAQQFIYFQF